MKNFLVPFRHFVFAAFIVCNAITSSTAVWNLGLSQLAGHPLPVDVFVTAVGGAALLFIFTTIIIELVQREPVTGRVWFECAWVGFFGVLEFCAAVALSATGPGVMCSARVTEFFIDACTSTRVVLAFSWICTFILFGYLLLLTVSAYMHKNENPQIWSCNVRRFDWGGTRTYIGGDGPKTLSLPQFVEKKRPGSIIIPKPSYNGIYTQPNLTINTDRYFQPQPMAERSLPVVPTAAPPIQQVQNARDATTFYPRHMQTVMASQPLTKPMKELPRSTSPPPLGDWPRPSIISEPRSKRQQPTRGFTVANPSPSNASTEPARVPRPTRPPFPLRSARSPPTSTDRRKIPPPLDLSKISSHTRLRS